MTDTYALKLEAQALERLKERIINHEGIMRFGDEPNFMEDAIRSEENLHRLLEKCTEELAAILGMISGIEGSIERMRERCSRYERQAEKMRDSIRQAMEAVNLKSLKTPAATLSLKANPPACIVYDEEILPKQYLVFQAPKPDKKAIKAALQSGENVPGASLSNQPDSLSVRFT